MAKDEPTFARRCQLMQETAEALRDSAEIVAYEAKQMAAAQKRFSERRGPSSQKASQD